MSIAEIPNSPVVRVSALTIQSNVVMMSCGSADAFTHSLKMRDAMPSNDDFRFNAHHFLLDLDAATNHLMMLVVSHEVTGSRWDEAVSRHTQAYAAWAAILTGINTDPLPALDGRPVEADNPVPK